MTYPTVDSLGLIRLDEDDCWRMLARHAIGRVAIVDSGAPLVFPVNYALDGKSVVFRAAPGTKLRRAGTNARAVFEVDDAYDVLETGSSVMVHGTLQVVEAAAERAALEQLGLRAWAPGDRDAFIRVVPDWVSGRRIQVHDIADALGVDGG